MQVEHVTGVSLTAGRAAQQQGDRAVRGSLLGQVVEADEHVLPLVHPVLADRRSGVRSQPLEPSRVGCRRRDDRRELQGTGHLQLAPEARDRRALLADGDVDALDLQLRVAALPVLELVDDRVDRDCALARAAVANDELTLPSTDWGHGVDRLDSGLQRLLNRLPLDDGRRLHLEPAPPRRTRSDRDRRASHRGSTVRPKNPSPTGTGEPRRCGVPLGLLRSSRASPSSTAPISRRSRLSATPSSPPSNSSSSLVIADGSPSILRDAVAGLGDATDLLARGLRRVRLDVTLDRAPDVLRPDRQLRHLGCPSCMC